MFNHLCRPLVFMVRNARLTIAHDFFPLYAFVFSLSYREARSVRFTTSSPVVVLQYTHYMFSSGPFKSLTTCGLLLSPAVRVTSSTVVVAGLSEAAVAEQKRLHPTNTGAGRAGTTVVAAIIKGQVVAAKVAASLLGSRVIEAVVGVLAKAEGVSGAGQAQAGEEGKDHGGNLE